MNEKPSNNQRTFTVKRLYHGLASVRDYIVEDCIKGCCDLRITCLEQKGEMLIPLKQLEKRFQIQPRKFTSKYNNREYGLYDFKFVPDEPVTQLRMEA